MSRKLILSQCDDCEREFYRHALTEMDGALLCEDCADHREDWEIRQQRDYERSLVRPWQRRTA